MPNLGYPVTLPGGGEMYLYSAQEVEIFERAHHRYVEDYQINRLNDLTLVGAILTQQIIMFRSQQRVAGLEAEMDGNGAPTGRYQRIQEQKQSDLNSAAKAVRECSKEIRELEQALGIDKKTRESGGTHTVDAYVAELKRAAHQMGVHIHERVLRYEKVMMEARWKLRVLRNGDDEDRAYHDITPEKILEWLERELLAIEELDKEWAKDKGVVFLGRL